MDKKMNNQKKRVLVIKLGQHRDEKSYQKLEKYLSTLILITVEKGNLKLSAELKENGNKTTGIYDIDALAEFIQKQDLRMEDYDLVLGCIDRPTNAVEDILVEISKEVERNKFYILCTSNILKQLNNGRVSMLNFLLYIIYGTYTRKYLGIDPEYHESPGCLLDYCFLKRDLIAGCIKPVLCNECEENITDVQARKILKKELKKIKIPLYIQLIEYIKQKPMQSIIIAAVASILFGMISSYMVALAIKGPFWISVITTILPLVTLCILIVPFFKKTKEN